MEALVPERRLRKPSAVGLRILWSSAKLEAMSAIMLVHSKFVNDCGEGYGPVVVKDGGI